MKKILKNIIFLAVFLITSCSQNFNTSKYNKQSTKYKICLQDADRNTVKNININEDRNDILQTDDTMIDLYNIGNDIDTTKLSKRRSVMIEDCMKSK